MYKMHLTHFMCADDSIYTFCNCCNALKAKASARFFVFFLFLFLNFLFVPEIKERRNHQNGDFGLIYQETFKKHSRLIWQEY